jgi:hypothetical protein
MTVDVGHSNTFLYVVCLIFWRLLMVVVKLDDDADETNVIGQDKGQDMWTQGVPNMPEQNYSSVHMNATDFFRRIHSVPDGAPALMACVDHF